MNYLNEWDSFAAQWCRNLIAAGEIPEAIVDERSIKEDLPDEEWLPVGNTGGRYEVSNCGRVRSVERLALHAPSGGTRRMPGVVLRQPTDSYGYKVAKIRVAGRAVTRKVHRLVAEAFIPNPHGKPQINHIDANKVNNSVANLEWVTAKEHGKHSAAMGLRPKGNQSGTAKLREADIPIIRQRLADGESATTIDVADAAAEVAEATMPTT